MTSHTPPLTTANHNHNHRRVQCATTRAQGRSTVIWALVTFYFVNLLVIINTFKIRFDFFLSQHTTRHNAYEEGPR